MDKYAVNINALSVPLTVDRKAVSFSRLEIKGGGGGGGEPAAIWNLVFFKSTQMPSPSSAVPTLLSQQIDRCLSLLQKPSSSDEDKFASLLLLPRLFASAGDEVEMAALVARVYEGMNVKFLTRMLRTTTTAATTARSHSSKASSLSSMLDAPMLHSVALEILDCFCTSFDRDLITGSSSSFSSSLPDLHRLVPCIPAMIQISLLSTSLSSSSSSSSSPPPHCNDPSEGKEDEGDLLSLNRELVLHCLDVMARCCESAQAVLLRPDILLSLVGHMLGSKEEEQEEEEEQGRGTTGNLLLNLFTCTQSLPTLESLDHIMTLLAQSFISKQTPLTFSILHLCIAVLSRAANFKVRLMIQFSSSSDNSSFFGVFEIRISLINLPQNGQIFYGEV